MSIDERLAELGIVLPELAAPAGAYVPAVQAGSLVFVSGQLPSREGEVAFRGRVGIDLELSEAQEAARLAVINALAAVKAQVGTLEQVERVVRLEVFVNSGAGFIDQAQVANGASGLLGELFGPAGQHARVAVGVAELPLDAAVELAMIVQVKKGTKAQNKRGT